MPKKLKGEPFGIFQHPFCHKTSKKFKRDPLGKFCFRKVSQCRKKLKEGPFGLARYCMLSGKKEETFNVFWFSSLGQMVQFDTTKFGRTFKNYFGQFVGIEKKSL